VIGCPPHRRACEGAERPGRFPIGGLPGWVLCDECMVAVQSDRWPSTAQEIMPVPAEHSRHDLLACIERHCPWSGLPEDDLAYDYTASNTGSILLPIPAPGWGIHSIALKPGPTPAAPWSWRMKWARESGVG
jgi:hypothetical protein